MRSPKRECIETYGGGRRGYVINKVLLVFHPSEGPPSEVQLYLQLVSSTQLASLDIGFSHIIHGSRSRWSSIFNVWCIQLGYFGNGGHSRFVGVVPQSIPGAFLGYREIGI